MRSESSSLVSDNPELRRRYESRVPLRRLALPEDVAEAVLFLASSAASYITAQVLNVDGGSSTTAPSPVDDLAEITPVPAERCRDGASAGRAVRHPAARPVTVVDEGPEPFVRGLFAGSDAVPMAVQESPAARASATALRRSSSAVVRAPAAAVIARRWLASRKSSWAGLRLSSHFSVASACSVAVAVAVGLVRVWGMVIT